MRRNALRVILGLYVLVVSPFLFSYLRTSSVAGDSKTTTARVTWSRNPLGSSQDDHGKSTYVYTVDGREYTGSAGLQLPVGSDLQIYYSQRRPGNSSWTEPTRARDRSLTDVIAITLGYGFMAMIAMVLMSVISPPGGTAGPRPPADDIGISGS
ncbi:MAG: hypothetical protein KF760_03570 [Candidatus Eremiobacteraeota bacterium]|nr:hypothetical protein [Candidatus Eremiobacteraeota bacterium]MCW5872299.1 hypothetical protein [Candidatus Eremiobacteraeota bacterium]